MDDLISRQAAADALCNNCDTVQAVCPHFPCKRYTSVEALPSADVQPVRHGWWIEDKEVEFVCSECGEQCANTVMGMPRDRYCKWCGARMDGEQDVHSK